jgi:hypothetical protein
VGLFQIAVVAAISLSGLLPSSCVKIQTPPQSTNATNAPVKTVVVTHHSANNNDLGVILLTNRCETKIDLGKGKTCTIAPLLLDRHDLQLTLSFGSKNAQGKPTGLSVMRVTAQSDKPVDITVNDMDLTFTPRLVE